MKKYLMKPLLSCCFMVVLSLPAMAIDVAFTKEEIIIDGRELESIWQSQPWLPLDQHILGKYPDREDFSGRYKLLWDKDYLYLLAEITDDVLFDSHPNPLNKYWDDDCLEIFIDEDKSGGNHQFNHNAFAYHLALDNQVVDIGTKPKDGSEPFILFNDHVINRWQRSKDEPSKIIWEAAIKVFDDSFVQEQADNTKARVKLTKNKQLGFMLAYCDNDGSNEREHFLGSTKIKPVNGDKNLGYITADVFDSLLLKK